MRLRGGGCSFDFNKLENEIKGGFSTGLPKWNTVTTGLNLTGVCKTPGCEAANKSPNYHMVGLGSHNIALESDKAVCSMCNNKLSDVKNMLFS